MLQAVHTVDYGVGPCVGIGAGNLLHVVDAQLRVGCRGHGFLAADGIGEIELHVRLAGGEPHFAGKNVGELDCARAVGDGHGVCRAGDERGGSDGPVAAVVGCGAVGAVVERHGDAASGVGAAPDCQRAVTLDYHSALPYGRQRQAAVIARNCATHRFGHYGRALGVGVDIVENEVLAVAQRGVEVNQFRAGGRGDVADGLLDEQAPVARARMKAEMIRAQGCQFGQDYAHVGIAGPQRVDDGEIVAREFGVVVRPVARVSVVDAEVDDGDVGPEVQRLAELRQLVVGQVAFAQQRGAGMAEVAHFVGVAEQALQLRGIGVDLAVGQLEAVGDTVAYAGHPDLFGCDGAERRQGRKRESE